MTKGGGFGIWTFGFQLSFGFRHLEFVRDLMLKIWDLFDPQNPAQKAEMNSPTTFAES
jgi:hypothetical protein